MRVAILVADGFTDSGLSVALDVLRTANAVCRRAGREPPFVVEVVAAGKKGVRAASGLRLAPTRPLSAAARAGVVMVPGLWVESAAEMDEVLARPEVRLLIRAIAAAHRRGALVGSSCGGAFLLAEAGILDGKEATTTWWLAPHLQQRRPAVRVDGERALVVEARVITSGAVFAQADLALHLVARFAGPTVARHCARLLLLDTHASQAAFMAVQQLTVNDALVRRAETWARAHLHQPFTVALLARHSGASARTLARRLHAAVGTSPIGFIQQLRVEKAVQLLQTTDLSLERISEQVGYGDANTLRRILQRHIGSSPREIRRRA